MAKMANNRFIHSLKHEELKKEIKQKLLCGKFKPGDKVPSQNEFCKKYGVSHNTVREAIGALVHEGLLYRFQGKGTFVAEKKHKPLTIGVVMPNLNVYKDIRYYKSDTSPVYIHFIESEARKNGANIILCFSKGDAKIEKESLCNLLARKVDGIIVCYVGGKKNLKYLQNIEFADIALVMIDRYLSGKAKTDFVVSDGFASSYQVTKTLLDKGFNPVFHFTNTADCSAVSERERGFYRALIDHDVGFNYSPIRKTSLILNEEEGGYDLAKNILKDKPRDFSFGIVAVNALMLVGAWRAIEEKKLNHNNIGLACFDPFPFDVPEEVTLIEVIQPLEVMARKSVQVILDKLSGKREIQQIILESDIRIVKKAKTIEMAREFSCVID